MKNKYKIKFTYFKWAFPVFIYKWGITFYFILVVLALTSITLYGIVDTRRYRKEYEREVQKINEQYRQRIKEMKTNGIIFDTTTDIDSAYGGYTRHGMELR